MLTIDLFEELEGPPEPTLIDALRDFLPIAIKHLKIKELPKIKLLRDVETENLPSFGKFSNDDRTVHLGIKNRHPNDVLRTLAHELTHYAQGEHGKLDADSWHTGSPVEDQANAEAGVIMREFNKQFPQYMALKPIVFEEWSKKYKKSINCSNPKGFSQKAHCAGKKKHTSEQLDENQEKYIIYLNDKPVSTYPTNREAEYQAKIIIQKFPTAKIDIKKEVCTLSPVQLEENLRSIAEGQHCDAKNAVPELKAALTKRKSELKNADAKVAYDKIDKIMTRIAQTYNISGQELHDLWTERYGEIPDTWVLDENFADGRGPGRPGDSQRHGIPKGATKAELEKASHAKGRKGQLARWQLNMRNGRKK